MLRFAKYFFLFTLLFCKPVFSQPISKNIKGKAFVGKKFVLLRWIPTDKVMLNYGVTYGYKIERVAVTDSLSMFNSSLDFENVLTEMPIKPIAAYDTLWNSVVKKNPNAAFVNNTLYPQINNKNNTAERKKLDETAFGLFLLMCDLDVEVAKLAGLFYKDSTIDVNKKYVYRISVSNGTSPVQLYEERLFVDASKLSPLPLINNLAGKFSDRKVELSWNVSNNKTDYASYMIERSEDSITFVRVNATPFVQLYSQFEKNKTEADYKDSLPQNGKDYYYRIRGMTHFGEPGPPGNCIKGRGKSTLSAYPLFDTVYTVENKVVALEWRMPEGFNYNDLKGYAVVRSKADNDAYRTISNQLIPVTNPVYTDSFPMFSNYYKIAAINHDNDTSYSFSWLVQMEDNEPPAIPLGLNATIDTLGIVKLSWKKNTDKDLKGYRLFRCNSLTEELTEITTEILTDTVYKDSIAIKTLSKDVFYSVKAVDHMYNNSAYANPLHLKRPDIIPPVAPVFTNITGNDSCVLIRWVNSTSNDVITYLLTKTTNENSEVDTIKAWDVSDTLAFIRDEKITFGKTYTYVLTVYDDAGNLSRVTSFPFLYEPGVRPMITKIKGKANYDTRSVELSWKYNYGDIYSYTLYKGKKGEALRIYKTIKTNLGYFEDKDMKANNVYVYKIKATFTNGAESRLSDAIEITY